MSAPDADDHEIGGMTRPPLTEHRYAELLTLAEHMEPGEWVQLTAGELRALLEHINRLHEGLEVNDVEACRLCGCTHATPCEPPCGWESEGLCTACAAYTMEAAGKVEIVDVAGRRS